MNKGKKNPQNPEIVGDKHFVQTKRRERKVRKGRMRRERLRVFLRFVFVLAALYIMYFVYKMPVMYLPKNAFSIVNSEAIQIINNNIVPTHKILTVLNSVKVPDRPVFLAKTGEMEKAIKQLTPVEDVYVRRYILPARMQIIIKERIPVILIAPDVNAQPVAYFTQDGKIVGREYLPLKINIKPLLEKVEYIDCRNPNDIYVKIPTVNIRVGKPDGQIFTRIARLPSILPQVKLLDSKIKYLDISWEKVNYLKLE